MLKQHKLLLAVTFVIAFMAFSVLYSADPNLSDNTSNQIVVALISLFMMVFFLLEFRKELKNHLIVAVLVPVAAINMILWSWVLGRIDFNPLGLWMTFFMAEFWLLAKLFERLAGAQKRP